MHRMVVALGLVAVALATAACPTDRVFRSRAAPPVAAAPPRESYPPPEYNPPPPLARAPIPPDPIIREEDLRDRRPAPPPKAPPEPPPPPPARTPPPPIATMPAPPPARPPVAPPPPQPPAALADDSSLVTKITAATTPQRAASLRLTEEGRKLLEAGDAAKALGRLEKTIAIDSTNPYGYYYLARAHYDLGRHQESLKFLDVAESLFANNPYWLAEIYALRGENYRALGASERADANYAQALRLNPGNRLAAEGVGRLQGEPQETR